MSSGMRLFHFSHTHAIRFSLPMGIQSSCKEARDWAAAQIRLTSASQKGFPGRSTRSTTSQAPDVYRCALRGFAEELGLHAPADFSASDLLFLSFAVDTQYCIWGLFGTVKLQKCAEEVLGNIQRGVRDRFENRRLFAVPFNLQEVCSFVLSHDPLFAGRVGLSLSCVGA